MSAEHVDEMNRAIEGSDEVRAACRALGRSGRVHYRLTGGPGGVVDWTADITPDGLSFGREEPAAADVVIERDYGAMMRSARAAREGREDPSSLAPSITGDVSLLTDLAPVLALARSVATIDVEFPDV